MANQPHPDKKAMTLRLHRDLIDRVQAAATQRGQTVVTFVTCALERAIQDGSVCMPRVRPAPGEEPKRIGN